MCTLIDIKYFYPSAVIFLISGIPENVRACVCEQHLHTRHAWIYVYIYDPIFILLQFYRILADAWMNFFKSVNQFVPTFLWNIFTIYHSYIHVCTTTYPPTYYHYDCYYYRIWKYHAHKVIFFVPLCMICVSCPVHFFTHIYETTLMMTIVIITFVVITIILQDIAKKASLETDSTKNWRL